MFLLRLASRQLSHLMRSSVKDFPLAFVGARVLLGRVSKNLYFPCSNRRFGFRRPRNELKTEEVGIIDFSKDNYVFRGNANFGGLPCGAT